MIAAAATVFVAAAVVAGQAVGVPTAESKCRTLATLRFKGNLYFHHELAGRRPPLGRRQGVGLVRACDDTPEEPVPWTKLTVYALKGVKTSVGLGSREPRAVYYDPEVCTNLKGDAVLLRCLRRH